MVFLGSVFSFAFMPLFFAVYSIVPWRNAKNVWLLANTRAILAMKMVEVGEPAIGAAGA